jgi:inosose dehydratase
MLKVATASVNWNNADLPPTQQGVGFPAILDLAHQAGYRAMEYHPLFGDDAATLLAEAGKREIAWCGSYCPVDLVGDALGDDELAEIEALVGLLASIGCHDLIVAEPGRPGRIALAGQIPEDGSASLPADAYPTMAANLHAIGALARRHEVRVHFHNHVGTWIETPAELDALMAHLDFDLVDLCFDTGHYAYGGGDALAFLRDHADRIGYLHLKDVDGVVLTEAKEQSWSFLEALRHIIFSPLGDGAADIPGILLTLVESKFTGWVVVEQDTCAGDPTETARANRVYIEEQLDSTTVRIATP